eukprot:7078130-Prorocentrum_lima.AAC.1
MMRASIGNRGLSSCSRSAPEQFTISAGLGVVMCGGGVGQVQQDGFRTLSALPSIRLSVWPGLSQSG